MAGICWRDASICHSMETVLPTAACFVGRKPRAIERFSSGEKVPLVARPIVSPLRVSGITLRQARSGCSIG